MSERVRFDPPHISTAAEQIVEALRRQHERIAIDVGRDESRVPAWYAHLPSGALFRIRLIGTRGPFVRFTGFGANETDIDFVLVAPESVVVTIRTLPPDSSEPRPRPIGFGDWPEEEAAENDSSRRR